MVVAGWLRNHRLLVSHPRPRGAQCGGHLAVPERESGTEGGGSGAIPGWDVGRISMIESCEIDDDDD